MISRRDILKAAPALPWGMAGMLSCQRGTSAELDRTGFRVATSSELLGDVNQNDARAALQSWSDVVSRMASMPVEYEKYFSLPPAALNELMQKRLIDAVGCTTLDYIPFAAAIDPNLVLVNATGQGQVYQLLVNSKSSIRAVADLRGKSLNLFRHANTCLAMDWVDTLLGGLNLGSGERFFSAVTPVPKLSRTVLPVFFGQADACLVTESSFRTMCELNPQLGVSLRVVAASPGYMVSLFGFHRECPGAMKAKFRTALESLARSATGKQLLTLFQTEAFLARDASVLRSAVELVEAAARLRRRYAGGR